MDRSVDNNFDYQTPLRCTVLATSIFTIAFDFITSRKKQPGLQIRLSASRPDDGFFSCYGDCLVIFKENNSMMLYYKIAKNNVEICVQDNNIITYFDDFSFDNSVHKVSSDISCLLCNIICYQDSCDIEENQHYQAEKKIRYTKVSLDIINFLVPNLLGSAISYFWLNFINAEEIVVGTSIPIILASISPLITALLSEFKPEYTVSYFVRFLLCVGNIAANLSSAYVVGRQYNQGWLAIFSNGFLGSVPMQMIMWYEESIALRISKSLAKNNGSRHTEQMISSVLLTTYPHVESSSPLYEVGLVKGIVGLLSIVRMIGICGFRFNDLSDSFILLTTVFCLTPLITSSGVLQGDDVIHNNMWLNMWSVSILHICLTKALQLDGHAPPDASYIADIVWFVLLIVMKLYEYKHTVSISCGSMGQSTEPPPSAVTSSLLAHPATEQSDAAAQYGSNRRQN